MGAWEDEMQSIREMRRSFYICPLPKKKQHTTMRAQRPGKVKIYTRKEILLYEMEKRLGTMFYN